MSFLNPFARSQKARGGPSSAQAPPTAQPGTPLELISYDTQSGKFFLGEDALEVLRKVGATAQRIVFYSAECCIR